MVYNDNQDIRKLIKRTAAAHDLTLTALAAKMGRLPQELNNTLNKKHIAIDDLKSVADALNIDLIIDFQQRESIQPTPGDNITQ